MNDIAGHGWHSSSTPFESMCVAYLFANSSDLVTICLFTYSRTFDSLSLVVVGFVVKRGFLRACNAKQPLFLVTCRSHTLIGCSYALIRFVSNNFLRCLLCPLFTLHSSSAELDWFRRRTPSCPIAAHVFDWPPILFQRLFIALWYSKWPIVCI